MFRSLRVRMAASHAAVMATIIVALGGSGYLLLLRSLDRAATDELAAAAEEQAHLIDELGRPAPPPDSDVPSRAAVRVAVYDAAGAPVGEAVEVPTWLHPYDAVVTDADVAGETVRIVTLPVERDGLTVATVVAARSLRAEQELTHRVQLLLLAGGGLAIAASLLAGWFLAGRAVKPVERAYESQASFAADASHELRTPLTFIRSGVEVLAERDPALGEQVLSEVDYLTGLTQRMLQLARVERGTMPLERAPFDVEETCRSAARRSERGPGNRFTLEGGAAVAIGDRIATEAALDAVLENVGVHGGGEAVIRWGREGDRATISVEDHGPGLSPALAERAFERFARGDPSRTRDTGGAGLGLALARTLVEAQGGAMWLEDTTGGGVTARIALPAS